MSILSTTCFEQGMAGMAGFILFFFVIGGLVFIGYIAGKGGFKDKGPF